MRALVRRRQPQPHDLHAVLLGQPPGEVGERLQQREAVDLQPETSSTSAAAARRPRAASMRRTRGGDQVGAEHVLQRPARPQSARAACAASVRMRPLIACDLVAHHTAGSARASTRRGRGQLEHFDRCLHVAERGAAALGQSVQQPVARRLLFEVAGDVVEHQHEAAQRPPPDPARRSCCAPAPSERAAAGRPAWSVTNCADGLATPRCMRCWTFSSAWATSRRSKTA